MFAAYTRWRRRRILARHPIDDLTWRRVLRQVQAVAWMNAAQIERLRALTTLFLHDKAIEPARDVELTDTMRVRIAAEACVPIIGLDMDDYDGFHSVIVYNEAFLSRDVYVDAAGVWHSEPRARAGEAWHRGPVIVSWADIAESPPGHNVVIHEMAHKLDMHDGDANGRPPLHAGMRTADWATAFSAAYEDFVDQVDAARHTLIDPYAATNPGEFFAVSSEVFFETPAVLRSVWPDVYRQMALYYRCDPASPG